MRLVQHTRFSLSRSTTHTGPRGQSTCSLRSKDVKSGQCVVKRGSSCVHPQRREETTCGTKRSSLKRWLLVKGKKVKIKKKTKQKPEAVLFTYYHDCSVFTRSLSSGSLEPEGPLCPPCPVDSVLSLGTAGLPSPGFTGSLEAGFPLEGERSWPFS